MVSAAAAPGAAPEQGVLLDAPTTSARRVDGPGVAQPVARILLETAVPHLDRLFDYLVPPELDVAAAVGTRVVVRFGGQDLHGWIWERADTTTHPGRLASIRRVVSDLPVLTPQTMRLVEAVAARTAGVRSDVVRLAVPARHATTEREERDRPASAVPRWSPPPADAWATYDGGPGFLDRLAAGEAPRAVWTALPGRPGLVPHWTRLVADAARAALAGGRGVLVVVATTERAEAVAAELTTALDGEGVAVLSAEHGPARRYRAFLRALTGRTRVVVGTRAAAFAPVRNLGLAVIWDDGDDRLDEPHAPYIHARTVLALRSGLAGTGLLIAGYTRSVEAQAYVEQGWATELSARRETVRAATARVQVPGAPELEAEGPSGGARIPSLAHRAVRAALKRGPVLVQVPRGGYAPLVACARCRAVARCTACSGPLAMGREGAVTCRWCARTVANWICSECGCPRLRMVQVGTTRTAEELGRAFPGVPVVASGAREDHGVITTVDARPRLVVATPGAEPEADGGYWAVLLLDGAALSARAELGAASEALRHWTNAAVLAHPDARVILLGGPNPVVAQALVRWDHAGFARRELTERAELHLPPAWRAARVDGPRPRLEDLFQRARTADFEVLGPVAVPRQAAGSPSAPAAPAEPKAMRGLIRAPLGRGRELAAFLRLQLRDGSVRREEPVRVELDPTVLW
ncbi:replication restart DNA helicase PriA [Actinomyces ruminicola]|uniref:Probable replication restart protein PriA n=1 Tax=Actinomyces ruminicola TaxID=332524 RepID=A0A1H0CZB8_9ACTO|nr:primosomal protein N' [Actinomyces ruminicola]SDN63242.1 replication restart DNA helicase PriA [Actinomyces ruminicola]